MHVDMVQSCRSLGLASKRLSPKASGNFKSSENFSIIFFPFMIFPALPPCSLLVDSKSHISHEVEVSSTITADQICPTVYKKIYTAIEETRRTFKHFDVDSPPVATPCSLCQSPDDHVACFSPDRAKITCTLDSDKTDDATKEMNYWFKDDNRTEVSDIKKSKPRLKEVFKLLRCKSIAWLDIVRELDLDYCDREQILKNIQKPKDEDKLEDVLYKWIESECSEVSWDNLYKALKELKLNDVAK